MKKQVTRKRTSKSSGKGSATSSKKKATKKTAKKKTVKKAASKVTKKKAANKATAKVTKKTADKTASKVTKKKVAKKKVAKKKAGVAPEKVKPRKRKTRRALAPFRARLLAKQQELIINYSELKGSTAASSGDGTEDYIDYAVSSYAKEFILSLTELDRKQLRLVEEALVRIEKGDYGSCQQCGNEIPEMRLEVAPWARHCVTCQELEDKGMLPRDYFSRGQEELDVKVDDDEGDLDDEESGDDDELPDDDDIDTEIEGDEPIPDEDDLDEED